MASVIRALRQFGFFMGLCVLVAWVHITFIYVPFIVIDPWLFKAQKALSSRVSTESLPITQTTASLCQRTLHFRTRVMTYAMPESPYKIRFYWQFRPQTMLQDHKLCSRIRLVHRPSERRLKSSTRKYSLWAHGLYRCRIPIVFLTVAGVVACASRQILLVFPRWFDCPRGCDICSGSCNCPWLAVCCETGTALHS